MTEPDQNKTIEQRFEEMDDVVVERCLAIMDTANKLHIQQSERIAQLTDRIDRMAIQVDRNALAIDRLTMRMEQLAVEAAADRAIMREMLQQMRNQYPGNGQAQ